MANRTEIVKVRLTPDEHRQLRDLAREHDMNLAELLRFMSLGPSAASKLPSQREILELRHAATRIGSNLNQLAKHVNSEALSRASGLAPDEVIKTRRTQEQIKIAVEAIRGEISEAMRAVR
jgi:hypothetical protein